MGQGVLRTGIYGFFCLSKKRSLLLLGMLALILCANYSYAEEIETTSVVTLPPANVYRLYVSDSVFSHMVDGMLHVLDTQNMKYVGMLPTGFSGHTTLSPDRTEIYLATTYYTRLNHGERVDVVEIYDAQTLLLKAEIKIPNKHAQALPYTNLIQTSYDGRYLFVQNATPATSITVVDLVERKFLSEVAIPGCWAIYPSVTVANRFSSLCGNGTVLTVTLDSSGQPAVLKHSQALFNPDVDPLFIHGEKYEGNYYFVSFHGEVYEIDLSGEEAVTKTHWSLLDKIDSKQGWRPGGYQLTAIQADKHRIFIAMHDKGQEGSHKNPAKQIWMVDLQSKKRLARLAGHSAISLAVTKANSNQLYAIDGEKGSLSIFDAGDKPKFIKSMTGIGETPVKLEVQ